MAERRVYIGDDTLSLVSYVFEDTVDSYNNWFDPETQSGYNFILKDTLEEYSNRKIRQRWIASIMLNETKKIIGTIGLSPENTPPDLAIQIYKPFRNRGYGTNAFTLGIHYCFDMLKLDRIYAGCYSHNTASRKMLIKCGFLPNPSGDIQETHFLTGEPITQFEYVLYNLQK